ncbi:MAG: ferrous iron transport protein B [bacterium]
MTECCDQSVALNSDLPQIALVGNPNSGKTTLFNLITGAHQQTGNWPGVTVELRTGNKSLNQQENQLVDLPGTYSLDNPRASEDEQIARRYLVSEQAKLIVNIVDATQLERSLYLTTQLMEFDTPMLLVLNMSDMLERQGMHIDTSKLEKALKVPIIVLSARDKKEHNKVIKAIENTLKSTKATPKPIPYPEQISQQLNSDLAEGIFEPLRQLEKNNDDIADLAADTRFEFANKLTLEVVQQHTVKKESFSEKIDQLILHPLLGIPIFLLAMYALFFLTIRIGGAFIDFFDIASGAIFVDGTKHILETIHSPDWIQVLAADGLGAGIQTVSTFIPIIGVLFFLLSILEDSGYMARAAFVMSRVMKKLGLSGKAFVPLIVGFGCNVPAIMSTRTLVDPRERITTVMMAPFMSCGARLTVYALFAAAFFPKNGQNIIFALYILGILIALATGLLLQKTVLKGKPEPFVMELPHYQKPVLRSLFIHSWFRLKSFIFDAGKLIVLMVVILNTMNVTSFSGKFGDLQGEPSVLVVVAQKITPIFKPLGIEQENWPATVGLISGLLAKEVVVGTLDALYSEKTDEAASIPKQLNEAISSISANLKVAFSEIDDPLSLNNFQQNASPEDIAEQQEVSTTTLAGLQQKFHGATGAFAYLLFILLYAPCASAIAAIIRETGIKWAAFSLAWSTTLAFSFSISFYQFSLLDSQPQAAAIRIGLSLLAIICVIVGLKYTAIQNQSVPKRAA